MSRAAAAAAKTAAREGGLVRMAASSRLVSLRATPLWGARRGRP